MLSTDVSLKLSSVCVVDAAGKASARLELKVPSELEALVQFFQQLEPAPVTIGLEGRAPLSHWLYARLVLRPASMSCCWRPGM